MKAKDIIWLENKIEDIKKRKRNLKYIQDPSIVKKIKKDLKREYRSAKRSEKNELNEWIKKEIGDK